METLITGDLHLHHYNVALHCNRLPWIYPNPKYDPDKPEHFKFNNPRAVHLESHDNDIIDNWNGIAGKKDLVYILGDLAWKNHAHYIQRLNGKKILIKGNHDKMSCDALRLFKEVHESLYRKINGQMVMLSHCPYETWFSSCHGSWNIHGHCHGRMEERVELLRFDGGIDAWNYKPVPWDIIKAKMLYKEELKKEYFANKEPRSEGSSYFFDINKDFNKQFMKG